MKITNGGTTNETISIAGQPVQIPVGAQWEVSDQVVARGVGYQDGWSNVVEVVLGPSSVAVITNPAGESYMESAFLGGASIGMMLLILVVVNRGLQVGIERG